MKVSYTLFALTHRFICRSVPALLHGSVTKQQRRKRRIMKKKVVSLLAAMALAVTALAGCGSNDAATTGTDAATVGGSRYWRVYRRFALAVVGIAQYHAINL